jgi:hypothetical protein
MHWIYYRVANYTPTLKPIMEEEEKDAEGVITSTYTSDLSCHHQSRNMRWTVSH